MKKNPVSIITSSFRTIIKDEDGEKVDAYEVQLEGVVFTEKISDLFNFETRASPTDTKLFLVYLILRTEHTIGIIEPILLTAHLDFALKVANIIEDDDNKQLPGKIYNLNHPSGDSVKFESHVWANYEHRIEAIKLKRFENNEEQTEIFKDEKSFEERKC